MATRFIELAGIVNRSMPEHVVAQCKKALEAQNQQLCDSRILLIGLAYKSNVDDCRESPTFTVMDLLHEAGAEVAYHDPHVPEIPQTREHAEWAGHQSVPWEESAMEKYDLAIILTAHSSVDHARLAEWLPAVVDTRNALVGIENGKATIWKA